MANRLPLVRVGGKNVQIPAGDGLLLRGPLQGPTFALCATGGGAPIGADVVGASNNLYVYGSGSIPSLALMPEGSLRRMFFFTACQLQNSSVLLLLTGANINAVAGDWCEFVSMGTSGWRMSSYTKFDGTALVSTGGTGDFKKDGSVQMTGPVNEAPIVTVASATTLPLPAANTALVTGTQEISAMSSGGLSSGLRRTLIFTTVLRLVTGSQMTLPNGTSSIFTAPGDTAEFVCNGVNSWICVAYQRKDGTALVGGSGDFKKDGTVQMTGPFNQASPYTFATGNPSGSGILDWTPATSDFGIVLSGNISSMTGAPTGARRTLVFAAGTVLTHAASILELPGNVDRTTALGDRAEFINRGSSRWQCLWYTKADGTALVAGAGFTEAQVRTTPMTGVVFTDKTSVVAADTLLAAVGKLQAQLSTGVFRTETIATTSVGQTSYAVPNGYTVGSIVAFFNGVLLAPADYTATDGANIVLASGALTTSDIMSVLVIGSVRAQDDALLSYTVAQLNAMGAAANARKVRWCSDVSGGPQMVVSNGTNWVRVQDLTVVTT